MIKRIYNRLVCLIFSHPDSGHTITVYSNGENGYYMKATCWRCGKELR